MAARSSWLLLLLVACGRTDHDARPTATGGSNGAGGATSVAGERGTAAGTGAGGAAVEPSCLYPVNGIQPTPPANVGALNVVVSPPFPIDVAPATWSDLGATLDLNGDLVSDLIYLDSHDASAPRFRLAMTARPPNVFEFSELDCAALRDLPAGRLLLRDLDADGVSDFVVGVRNGIRAFLNHQTGLEQVLDFSFPSPTDRAPLINLGAVDLDGDGRIDLVAGYDRVESEQVVALDVGVQSFLQQADGHFEPGLDYSARAGSGDGYTGDPYMGYLAVGRFGRDDRGSSVLVWAGDPKDLSRVGDQTSFDGVAPTPLLVPDLQERIFQVFSLQTPDGHAVLLATGAQNFYVLDLSRTPAAILTKQALLFEGGFSHELGGGSESPRYFLYDYDHDGDVDFFERSGDGQVAIHPNHANANFDAPLPLQLNVRGGAENPFLYVGPISGIVAHVGDDEPSSAVYTLRGEETAPPLK